MDSVYFRSSFWNDPLVRSLKPIEKLLYVYLFTNQNIPPSGIYEFLEDDCRCQTGLSSLQIKKVIELLTKKEKVLFVDGWIFVVSFLRKSFNLPKRILSKTIATSISNQFSANNIPNRIIACFYSFYHTLSIPYPYPPHIIEILGLGFRFEIKEGEREKEEKTPPPEITPEELKNLWNKNRGKCPEAQILNSERTSKANIRIKEQPALAYWQTVCKKIRDSNFLQGIKPSKEHPNWKATFDWLIDNGKNHVKIYEGNYDSLPHEPEEKQPIISKDPKTEQLWEKAKAKIEGQINQESFDMWFAPTVGLAINGEELEIAVPNQLFANWIPDHYSELIKEALGGREYVFVVVPNMRFWGVGKGEE